jgi:hypothetical protein
VTIIHGKQDTEVSIADQVLAEPVQRTLGRRARPNSRFLISSSSSVIGQTRTTSLALFSIPSEWRTSWKTERQRMQTKVGKCRCPKPLHI